MKAMNVYIKKNQKAGGMAQMVELMPHKCWAPSLNTSTPKRMRNLKSWPNDTPQGLKKKKKPRSQTLKL
jgi:hypothetical protein